MVRVTDYHGINLVRMNIKLINDKQNTSILKLQTVKALKGVITSFSGVFNKIYAHIKCGHCFLWP